MALQSYVDKQGPVVSAAWLNAVDIIKETILANPTTKEQARTALTSDAPLELVNGGTGSRLGPAADIWQVTAQETGVGATIVEWRKPPGHIIRYGADPTATNDSSVAIATAFAVGGAVTADMGEYLIDSPINVTITRDVYFQGNNALFTCTFDDDLSYDSGITITGTSSSRVFVENLSIRYTGVGQETVKALNIPVVISEASMTNVKVSGFPYFGGEIGAAQQTHTNCRFVDNYHAGFSFFGGSIALMGCVAQNNGDGATNDTGYGVIISGTNCLISGGRYVDNDRYNIEGRRANNITVHGAYVGNAGYVNVYCVNQNAEKDTSNIKIVNCFINGNNRAGSAHGIWVGAYGTAMTASTEDVSIIGTTIKNCLGKGILMGLGELTFGVGVESVLIKDNIIKDCGDDYGLFIDGDHEARSIIISNNQMYNAGQILSCAAKAALHTVITGNINTWSGTQARALHCESFNAVIRDNIFSGTISGSPIVEVEATNLVMDGNIAEGFLRQTQAGIDPGNLNVGESWSTTVSVTGALLGDIVDIAFSLDLQGMELTAYVASTGIVSATFTNINGGGAVNLGSGTLYISLKRNF